MVSAALSEDREVEAVVIGGSAGSVAALGEILPALPAYFAPVLVVVHVIASARSLLAEIFAPRCAMRVREAEPFAPIEVGSVYFAPADYHLLVERDRRCSLSIEPPVHFSRPSIDVLFESAAHVYGAGLVGIVLTGASSDGARGLEAVHDAGGRAFVQDPRTAQVAVMPNAAQTAVPDACVLDVRGLVAALQALAKRKS